MFKDKAEALKFIKEQGIEIIDLRFMDFRAFGNISQYLQPSLTKMYLTKD